MTGASPARDEDTGTSQNRGSGRVSTAEGGRAPEQSNGHPGALAADRPSAHATDRPSALAGHRLTLLLYGLLVALSGGFGFVIGLLRPADLDPELFFLVELPPSPLGVALYGALTVAVVLGSLLALVTLVGNRFDRHAR